MVTFNGNVNVLQAPTIDPGQLQRALANSPQLGYGTHLFDAVRPLAQDARGREDLRRLDRAPLRRRGPRQHVHAEPGRRGREGAARACLHGRASLRRVRRRDAEERSRRRRVARTPRPRRRSELAGIYSQLGSLLSREYLLTYRSLAAPSSTVDVAVSLDGVGSSDDAVQGADAVRASAVPPAVLPAASILSGWSLLLLALVVAGLIAVAVRLLARRGALAVRRADSPVLRRHRRRRGRREGEGGRGLAAPRDPRPRLGLGCRARLDRSTRRADRHRPDQALVDVDHRLDACRDAADGRPARDDLDLLRGPRSRDAAS